MKAPRLLTNVARSLASSMIVQEAAMALVFAALIAVTASPFVSARSR